MSFLFCMSTVFSFFSSTNFLRALCPKKKPCAPRRLGEHAARGDGTNSGLNLEIVSYRNPRENAVSSRCVVPSGGVSNICILGAVAILSVIISVSQILPPDLNLDRRSRQLGIARNMQRVPHITFSWRKFQFDVRLQGPIWYSVPSYDFHVAVKSTASKPKYKTWGLKTL